MKDFSVKDLVNVTKGKLLCGDEHAAITNIVTDSRILKKGDLFVPLIGEKVDAHTYLVSSLEKCSAAFTMEHDEADDAMRKSGTSVIRVEDTLKAMQQVAIEIRNRYPLPVIGVTGSVGKTTTREMIATALSAGKKVFETYKNYNSQVGVPLTLARLSEEYEIGVLEMGMSNPGEMIRLSAMIRPNTAVMTCIGVSHIEQLKTQDNICREKLEITHFMKETDKIYLNGDDPILYSKKDDIKQQIVWYGTKDYCDYRAEQIRVENGEQVFDLQTPTEKLTVRLQVLGEHNVRNAAVAIAVAEQYGIQACEAAKALYSFQGQRQKIVETDTFTIIDDTYNASPDSMKAAILVLRDMPCEGKRIAVLADMLELGEQTVSYHEQVGQYVKENHIDYLITYGELANHIREAAGIRAYQAKNLEDVVREIQKQAQKGDIVLLKGSNGMKLSQVVEKIS